ncbi:MAG TPA: low molecular weight protein-tyrosine-phosphatase [Jatrophihabitans sp.]|nr:low molecular weight protein-tyrosine-phosphatase [Jatrophihabitans sp.]
MPRSPVRICFVCSGNICRSPTAEVVAETLARVEGLVGVVVADSAGTGRWHVGEDMDERARRTLLEAGYTPGRHVAKQFAAHMFDDRDLVVALDSGHRDELWDLAGASANVAGARAKIVRLREYDPLLGSAETPDVADPYYGGARGFVEVLEQVERSCRELLAAVHRSVRHGQPVVQQADNPPS